MYYVVGNANLYRPIRKNLSTHFERHEDRGNGKKLPQNPSYFNTITVLEGDL